MTDPYIDNFEDWPANLDPNALRAHVVAAVNQFPEQERHDMAEWMRDGDVRVDPTDPEWCDVFMGPDNYWVTRVHKSRLTRASN